MPDEHDWLDDLIEPDAPSGADGTRDDVRARYDDLVIKQFHYQKQVADMLKKKDAEIAELKAQLARATNRFAD